MLKSQTREIDGHEYIVTQQPFRQANETLRLIGACIGPALADLGAALNGAAKSAPKGKALEADVDLGKLGQAFGALFMRLEPGQLDKMLMGGLFQGARVRALGADKAPELSSGPVYDEHFAGNFELLFKVAAFCFEVQFGNFFAKLSALMPRASAPPLTSLP